MNPLFVGASIVIAILLLLFGKPAVDTFRKVRANTKTRMEMFELIGAEWIMRMNTILGKSSVARDAIFPIRERFSSENNEWLLLVPVYTVSTGAKFAMVIGATMVLPAPKPHVKSILMDLIIVSSKRPEWWLDGHCTQVLIPTKDLLAKQGIIFDVADKDTV